MEVHVGLDYTKLPQSLRELIETRLRYYCPKLFEPLPEKCPDCESKRERRHWKCFSCGYPICWTRHHTMAATSLMLTRENSVSYGHITFTRHPDDDSFLCVNCAREAIEEWSLLDWEKAQGYERSKPEPEQSPKGATPKPSSTSRPNGRPRNKISPTLRFRIFQRDGFKCVRCGRSCEQGVTLAVDHRIPVAKGGTESETNLQTLCSECNAGKADKLEAAPANGA